MHSPRVAKRSLSVSDFCHAWVYRPEGGRRAARVSVIVMAHGLGAVKRLRLEACAERFAASGFSAGQGNSALGSGAV